MKKSDVKTEDDVIRFLSHKTTFERSVLVATFKIPKGKVSTYKRIADKIGKPKLTAQLQMHFTRTLCIL